MNAIAVVPRLLIAAGFAGGAIVLVLNCHHLDVERIEQWTRDLGAWAPVGHVVLFAAGTVLFASGAVFDLVGGALFGPWWGALLNLLGATIGAIASFLVARWHGQMERTWASCGAAQTGLRSTVT